ncbi:PD-(D/E)XK nuclease family protein [Capnocytophaga leadbetteri]|uniref:PDDEXK-like family protein n=1 Tax=Capnocytophaga leadbetteri TaxID=327575 RepID=UPI0028E455D6|nr:PD-(D/E)XK nuclease family protein [Capnocytophaga leadbetteri]
MKELQNLLQQVATITQKNNEILNATGGRFNMFRICGVNHYENTHSAIIAELLNPKGTHSLKSELLKAFLSLIDKDFVPTDFNPSNATVYTEYTTTDKGRIDILIKDANKNALIIENKIYAADQYEQLKRYDQFAKKEFKAYQIYYLTLWGSEASLQSGEGVNYLTISYADTIIRWLDKCIALAARLPLVRETLIQYSNHLKILTNQDMNAKNQEEIVKTLADFGNLEAVQNVFLNYPKVFDYLAKQYFNPKMEEFAHQKGLIYHYERTDEKNHGSYISFYITKEQWKEKIGIDFDFEEGSYYYGVYNDPKKYQLSQENKTFLHQQLREKGIPVLDTDWYPFYENIESLTIASWESDIVKSDIFFKSCKSKIETLLEVLEEMDL